MFPRNIVLSSSTLLGAVLLITLIYSLTRVLSASEGPDSLEPLSQSNAAIDTPAATAAPAVVGPSPAPESAPLIGPEVSAISDEQSTSAPGVGGQQPASAPTTNSPVRPPEQAVPSPSSNTQPVTREGAAPTPTAPQPTGTSAIQAAPPAATAAVATPRPRLTASSQGVESVRFVKEVNDKTLIIYRGQDLWLVEHDSGCADLSVPVGGTVLIYSPGNFPASATRIVTPNGSRDCTITGISPI